MDQCRHVTIQMTFRWFRFENLTFVCCEYLFKRFCRINKLNNSRIQTIKWVVYLFISTNTFRMVRRTIPHNITNMKFDCFLSYLYSYFITQNEAEKKKGLAIRFVNIHRYTFFNILFEFIILFI